MSIRISTAKVNEWIVYTMALPVFTFLRTMEEFEVSPLGNLNLETSFDHHWVMEAHLSQDYYTLALHKTGEDTPVKKVIVERDKLILLNNTNPTEEYTEVGKVFFTEDSEIYHLAIKDLCEEKFSYDGSLWGMEAHAIFWREEGLFCTCKDNDTGELYDYPL